MAITIQVDGNWTVATQVWAAGTIIATPTRWAVYQFEGLPSAYVQGTLATAFEMVLPGLSVSVAGTQVTAYAVVSRHADPASGRVIPDYLLVELDSTVPSTFPTTGDWTISGTMDYATATDAERVVAGAFNQAWGSSYRDSNGDLARTILIVVKVTGGTGTMLGVSGTATLTVTETTDRTGLVGSQYIRDWDHGIASGIIECPKTGLEIARDEAVVDGYSRQLVHPDGYDPPMPRSRPRANYVRPRRGGGY